MVAERLTHPLYPVYLYFMECLGLGIVALSWYLLYRQGTGFEWVLLAVLAVLSGSLTVKIPGINSKVSVADAFIFANIVLYGPAVGAITAILDGLMVPNSSKSAKRKLHYKLFNVGVMALSAFAGAQAFSLMFGRVSPHQGALPTLGILFPSLIILATVYYLVNTGCIAAIVALEAKKNVYGIWRDRFRWIAINYYTAALIAGLLAFDRSSITPVVVGCIAVILLVIHLTNRGYVKRFADSLRNSAPQPLSS
jgi:hypothetical protein